MIGYSNEAKRLKVKNALWAGLGSAVMPVFLTHEEFSLRIVLSAIAFVVGSSIYWLTYPWLLRRNLRKLVREAINGQNNADVEIEFTSAGIQAKTNSTKIEFEWIKLTSITEEHSLVEFRFGPTGLVVVQKRALEGQPQLDSLLSFAKEHAPSTSSFSLRPGTA